MHIYVATCDKYDHLMPGFAHQFNKYWSPQQQVDNLNVALNQLAPAVATVPGGVALVAAIAKEFAKVNQYSRDFQDAAEKFAAQAAQVSDMQVQMASMPPMPPPPPPPMTSPPSGESSAASSSAPTANVSTSPLITDSSTKTSFFPASKTSVPRCARWSRPAPTPSS